MPVSLCAPLPTFCARLLALAERDPRRAARLARRVWQHAPLQDQPIRAWAMYTLGRVLLRWERLPEARRYLQPAHALFRSLDLPVAALHCRQALLTIRQLDGEGQHLQSAWQKLADSYLAHGLVLEAARTRFEQIAHLNVLVRSGEALALVNHIQAVVQQEGTLADQARLLRLAGSARVELGQLDQAETCLDQAMSLYASQGYKLEVAKTHFERAWLYQRRERFQAAYVELEHARRLFQRYDLPLRVAVCAKDIGLLESRLGHYAAALATILQARSTFQQLGRHDYVAHCDLTIGVIAYYSGLFDLSMAAYRRAQTVYTELGILSRRLISQRNQALTLRAQGQPAAALELLATLVEPLQAQGDRLELAELRVTQAQALRDLGQYAQAQQHLQTAREQFVTLGNTPAAAECRLEEGWVQLDLQNTGAAVACFNEALPALTERPVHSWRVTYGLGRAAQMQGQPAAALRAYQEASTIVAGLRRKLASEHASSGIFAQARQLYRDAIQLAADLDDPLTMLTLAEQQRALALQRQVASSVLHIPLDLAGQHEQQREYLRALMAGTPDPQTLDGALRDYTDLVLRARHQGPMSDNDERAVLAFDIDQLRHRLDRAYPGGWTVLATAMSMEELFLITLTSDDLCLTRMAYDTRLRQRLRRVSLPEYRMLTFLDLPHQHGQTTTAWADLAALGELLLPAHLRDRLHPEHRLLLVPSGPLHAVPWAALRIDDAWLCERAVVQHLPGLAFHSMDLPATPASDAALLIGCNHFGGRAPDLPGALDTLDLAQSYWGGSVTRVENAAATRSNLRAMASRGELRPYGLIHIASHAQLVATRGLLAHLKLFDDDLLFDEVGRLELGRALVVLAACEGASSEVLPGDEVLSVHRAFLAAGAQAVIASLWQVYDQAVAGLLDPLYAALSGGHDPAAALTRAQRSLIARSRQTTDLSTAALVSPLVWASFCVLSTEAVLAPVAGGTTPAARATA